MTLIERVTRLIRSNLNDLVDKAEDPEKMIKQMILDMETELQHLKSQLAVSIADQHLLEKRHKECALQMAEWMRKAELTVEKGDEALARTALERYLSDQELARSYEKQLDEQKRQVDDLKAAFFRLEQRLAETRSTGEMFIAQYRRSHSLDKASAAQIAVQDLSGTEALKNLQDKAGRAAAVCQARASLAGESPEARLDRL